MHLDSWEPTGRLVSTHYSRHTSWETRYKNKNYQEDSRQTNINYSEQSKLGYFGVCLGVGVECEWTL